MKILQRDSTFFRNALEGLFCLPAVGCLPHSTRKIVMSTVVLGLFCGFGAIAASLVGGVFLAFSDFLMVSMADAGEPAGSTVMKAINVRVMRSVFIFLFFLLVPMSVCLAGAAYAKRGCCFVTGWLSAASAVYVVGCFFVTGAGNVPMNNRLAELHGSEASEYWQSTYLTAWTLLNTIRTVACMLCSVAYLVVLSSLNNNSDTAAAALPADINAASTEASQLMT